MPELEIRETTEHGRSSQRDRPRYASHTFIELAVILVAGGSTGIDTIQVRVGKTKTSR